MAGKDVLLVQRFDRVRVRDGYLRYRMVSALTALGAEDAQGERSRWSYLLLADELRRRSSRPNADLEELFGRMVFNALISNTDDHPRNHALIAPARDWELSPAYDLTPNPLTSQEKRDLAMTCGTFNRYANRANLLSQHAQFKLALEHATSIVDRIQQVVALRWHAALRQQGTTPADCERLGRRWDRSKQVPAPPGAILLAALAKSCWPRAELSHRHKDFQSERVIAQTPTGARPDRRYCRPSTRPARRR